MTTVDSPKTISPALNQAYTLLRMSIFKDLDYAECLAGQDWDDREVELMRKVVDDLITVVRGMMMAHDTTEFGNCTACRTPWPCSMTETIYALVKDPNRKFEEIIGYVRETYERYH